MTKGLSKGLKTRGAKKPTLSKTEGFDNFKNKQQKCAK